MSMQRTIKTNFEKEKGRNDSTLFQDKQSNQMVCYWSKDRYVDQRNKVMNLGIHSQ